MKYVRKTVTWNGHRYEVRGSTEREAIEKLTILKEELKSGHKGLSENTTVNTWFEEWMTIYKEPAGLTPKSLAMYRQKYENHIRPKIGPMKMKDVKEAHLQRILNEQSGMSFSHVAKVRLVIKAMFSRAYQSHLIPWDPSVALTLPATKKGTRRSLTEDERSHILEVAKTHRAGLWVLTILYTGMRPGETAALQWKDIDLKDDVIHVYKALESGRMVVKDPKTEAGYRDIPIHPNLRERLVQAQKGPFDPVFTTTRGTALSEDAMQRLWHSFIRALDIHMGAEVYRNKIVQSKVAPDLTAYCLRHTFCTDLQRAGVPINVAKELMGHSDISVTANIYTHKDQNVLNEAIKKLAGVG